MKKVIFVFALALLMTAGVFADHPDGLGIGVQFNGGGGWGSGGFSPGAALSLKVPSLPIFWTVNLEFGSDQFGLGVSGDFYIYDSPLVQEFNLHWYLGFGVGAGLWGFNDKLGFGASARLPVGLSWQPIDLVEVYLQIVPSIGLQVLPKIYFPYGGWGGNLGIRVWL